jgi:ribulose-phosphate 3-epimerase
MNNIVSPSILSCDFLNIEKEIDALKGIDDLWIHLDIMDGHFVPNLTFGIPIVKQICSRFDIPMDAHLMVENPEFHMEEMKSFGLENITFHLEAVKDPMAVVKKYKENYKSIGISIKPKTQVDEISDELLKSLGLVLVMSVEPGFGGQSFMEDSLDKVKVLKQRREALGLSFQIQIDGGISDKNAKRVRESGADNLVAGSFVFKADPQLYPQRIESLR